MATVQVSDNVGLMLAVAAQSCQLGVVEVPVRVHVVASMNGRKSVMW